MPVPHDRVVRAVQQQRRRRARAHVVERARGLVVRPGRVGRAAQKLPHQCGRTEHVVLVSVDVSKDQIRRRVQPDHTPDRRVAGGVARDLGDLAPRRASEEHEPGRIEAEFARPRFEESDGREHIVALRRPEEPGRQAIGDRGHRVALVGEPVVELRELRAVAAVPAAAVDDDDTRCGT